MKKNVRIYFQNFKYRRALEVICAEMPFYSKNFERKIYLFAIVGQLIEFLGKAKEGKQSEKEICAIAQAGLGQACPN